MARGVAAALVALAVLAAPAWAGIWKTYTNERFGATADVPATWTAGEPPANGDGLRFTSPDGKAWIAVWGGFQTFDTVGEAMDILEAPNEGETITYRHRDDRTSVVSGTYKDRIFYRKAILTCANTIWDGVEIDYPAAEKKHYAPIVEHVADSLREGPGYQAENCKA